MERPGDDNALVANQNTDYLVLIGTRVDVIKFLRTPMPTQDGYIFGVRLTAFGAIRRKNLIDRPAQTVPPMRHLDTKDRFETRAIQP